MAARAGAGDFIDPGDELSAEQPSCGVDILISDHVYIFHLGEFDTTLGTGIACSVIGTGMTEPGLCVVHIRLLHICGRLSPVF